MMEKKVQWMDLNSFKTSETPTSQRPLIKKKKTLVEFPHKFVRILFQLIFAFILWLISFYSVILYHCLPAFCISFDVIWFCFAFF